jgi:hypothetical protein
MKLFLSASLVSAAVLMVGCSSTSTGSGTSLKSDVRNSGIVLFEGSF